MIRVLQNIGTLANGGMESFIMNLYRNIDKSKVQFDFVVGHRTDWCETYNKEIQSMGGRVYCLDETKSAINQFAHFLKNHPEYKIVHSHRNAKSALFLSVAALCGVKVRISHVHSTSENNNKKKFFTKVLLPLLNIIATKRLACGQAAGEYFFKKHAFEIFPNSIDIEKYRYTKESDFSKRSEIGFLPDDIIIGHVGRFSVEKNHEFLVRVFAEIHKREQRTKLLLIGAGGLKPMIVSQINQLDLQDSVVLLENRSDVHELLQIMNLVVFPSHFEGFSMAMIEMQAAGLKILASKGIPSEINVTGAVSFLNLNCSESDWADKALEMLDYNREDTDVKPLYDNDLDVHANAEKMCKLYLSLYKQKYGDNE